MGQTAGGREDGRGTCREPKDTGRFRRHMISCLKKPANLLYPEFATCKVKIRDKMLA